MRNPLWYVVLVLTATSCITARVVEKPSNPIDFTKFRTVSYSVHASPQTEYTSGDEEFGRNTIALFDTMLGQKLRSLGYKVVEQSPDLSIDIDVKAVKSGSAAARFLVGFGAGRAVFLWNAVFTDAQGNRLGVLQGGRSHTGMEFGESFAGNEQIQAIAVTASIRQIEDFIKHGGGLRSRQSSKEAVVRARCGLDKHMHATLQTTRCA